MKQNVLEEHNPQHAGPAAGASCAPKLAAACGPDGLIRVRLDEDVVTQRISHDMYSDPKSALRELYANEVRACKTARDGHGASPRIDITVDPLTRGITIHGSDSLGINQDVFLRIMAVLGKSDNTDGRTAGQFGMGFASYTCLSDVVIVETHSRVTGERYAVMGKSGIGFQPLPEPTQVKDFGTRIALTVRKDVKLVDLIHYVGHNFWHSGIETYLHLPSPLTGENGNEVFSAGMVRIGPYGPVEYMAGALCDRNGFEFPGSVRLSSIGGGRCTGMTLHAAEGARYRRPPAYHRVGMPGGISAVEFHAEDDDIEIHGLTASSRAPYGHRPRGCPAYSDLHISEDTTFVFLAGMPIRADFNRGSFRRFSSVTVNVKDERKYMPTPDRERFREEALSRLRERVDRLLSCGIPECRPRELYDWHRFGWSVGRGFECPGSAGPQEETYRRFIGSKVRCILPGESTSSTFRGSDVIPDSPDCLSRMVYMRAITGWKVDAIRSAVPGAVIFSVVKPNDADDEMIRRLGVMTGAEVLSGNRLAKKDFVRLTDSGDVVKTVTLYGCRSRYGKAKMSVSQCQSDALPKGTILAVPPEMWDAVSSVVCEFAPEQFHVTRKTKRPVCGITDIGDYTSRIAKSRYVTNRGMLTGADIADSGASPIYVPSEPDSDDASKWPSDIDAVLVSGTLQNRMGLYMYLKLKGVDVSHDEPNPVSCILGREDLSAYELSMPDVDDTDSAIGLLLKLRGIADRGVLDMAVAALDGAHDVYGTSSKTGEIVDDAVRIDGLLSGMPPATGDVT